MTLIGLRTVLSSIRGNQILGQVLQRAAGTAALKFIGMLLSLGGAALLARLLRPAQYGAYSFALSTITLLALPVQFGLPQLIIREVAKYQLLGDWPLLRGLLLRANQFVAVLSVAVGGLLFAALLLSGRYASVVDIPTFIWAAFLLPFIALSQIRGAVLQGLRHVVQGQIPESVIRPGLFMALIFLWSLVSPLRSWSAMALQVGAAIAAFAVGLALLVRYIPAEVKHAKAAFENRTWLRSIIPLSMTDALQVINVQADLILLGFFTSATAVGLYRAAALIAYQISVGLAITNMVLGPYFARLYYAKDTAGLQKIVTQSVRLVWVIAIPVTIACILSGREIIALVFGKAYVDGATSLAILAIGQMVNGVTGPGTLLLNMTGHERDVTRVILLTALINVLVNLLLIPKFGILGAAMTTTFALLVGNIWLTLLLKRRLGIRVF